MEQIVVTTADSRAIDLDEPTQSLIAGIAGLHALLIVVDGDRRLRWLSDRDGLLGEGATAFLGRPIDDLRAELADHDGDVPDAALRAGLADLSAAKPFPDERASSAPSARRNEAKIFESVTADGDVLRILVADRPATPSEPDSPTRIAKTRSSPSIPEASQTLAEKVEELELCIRSLSHDLRSPLVSIFGFTRLLREEFGEPIGRTGQHFLDRIEQATRGMERLIRDMLELSRLDDMPRCPVHVNPVPVLHQVAAEWKLQLDEGGIELDLPSQAPILVCDRTQLYQVFSNLIGNAIRHSVPGKRGRIDVCFESVDDGWQIVVRDDGPGIAPMDARRIFDAFQTAPRPGQPKKSSGLGLAIVKKIVDGHGGRVWVESELGRGARFYVWLPRT